MEQGTLGQGTLVEQSTMGQGTLVHGVLKIKAHKMKRVHKNEPLSATAGVPTNFFEIFFQDITLCLTMIGV